MAGTAVLTTVGVANIEDIRTGDYVYAKDEETGQQKYMPVLETYEREVNETYTVTIEGESIETTGSHPFYTEEEGWTKAEELKAGDKIELSDRRSGEVESVERNELEEPVTVYNFCVMDYHTYYVGESSVLVHNKCNASSAGSAAKSSGAGTPTSNTGKGFDSKGYFSQPGERTLDGYVKNNANPEISLKTSSPGFNNNNGNVGGVFKRFGAGSHGGASPHVHQPQRNVAPNGNIYGAVGTKTFNGGVTSPSIKDVKQLYEFLNNGKYQ